MGVGSEDRYQTDSSSIRTNSNLTNEPSQLFNTEVFMSKLVRAIGVNDLRGQVNAIKDVASAHKMWRERRHYHACTLADTQSDHRVAEALRSRFVEVTNV